MVKFYVSRPPSLMRTFGVFPFSISATISAMSSGSPLLKSGSTKFGSGSIPTFPQSAGGSHAEQGMERTAGFGCLDVCRVAIGLFTFAQSLIARVQRHSYLGVVAARWRFRSVGVSDCTKDFVAAGFGLVFDHAFATTPFAIPSLPLNIALLRTATAVLRWHNCVIPSLTHLVCPQVLLRRRRAYRWTASLKVPTAQSSRTLDQLSSKVGGMPRLFRLE